MGGSDWVTGGGLFGGMPTMTGKQIYENFQHGTGSASLHGASREVQKLGKDYGELQQSIEDLMTRMKPHWKGKAGALARHGAGPIAVEFAAAKPKLHTTQDLVRRQGELFDRTKATVVPVPDKPEAPSGWGSMLAEGASVVFLGHDTDEVDDYESQLSAHNDAAQHNVNQMHKYSTGSDYNTTNLPDSYGKMLGSEGEIRIDHSGGGNNSDTSNGTGNAPGSTTGNYQGHTPGGYDNGGTQPGGNVPAPAAAFMARHSSATVRCRTPARRGRPRLPATPCRDTAWGNSQAAGARPRRPAALADRETAFTAGRRAACTPAAGASAAGPGPVAVTASRAPADLAAPVGRPTSPGPVPAAASVVVVRPRVARPLRRRHRAVPARAVAVA